MVVEAVPASAEFNPSAIQASALRQLHSYWRDRAGERPMPARADLSPVGLKFVLGNLMMIEVLREPLDFRVKVHGTNMSLRAGYDLTGKMLNCLPDANFRALARQSFSTVALSGQPLHALRHRIIDDRIYNYETLMLPLSSEPPRVEAIMVGLIYGDEAASGR